MLYALQSWAPNGIKHHLCAADKVRMSPPPAAARSGWSVDLGENTLCKATLVLCWSKSSPTSHYKTNHSFLIPNNRIAHILVSGFASTIILRKSLESLYCCNPYERRKPRQGICIMLPCFPTTWLSVVLFCMLILLKTIQEKAKIWSVKVTDQWQCESVKQQQKIKGFIV